MRQPRQIAPVSDKNDPDARPAGEAVLPQPLDSHLLAQVSGGQGPKGGWNAVIGTTDGGPKGGW